jgi:hypothetical protein
MPGAWAALVLGLLLALTAGLALATLWAKCRRQLQIWKRRDHPEVVAVKQGDEKWN